MNSCIFSCQMSHVTWVIFYNTFKPNQNGWKRSGRRLAVHWSKICFHQIVQYLCTCTCLAHLLRESLIFSDLWVFCPSADASVESEKILFNSWVAFKQFFRQDDVTVNSCFHNLKIRCGPNLARPGQGLLQLSSTILC